MCNLVTGSQGSKVSKLCLLCMVSKFPKQRKLQGNIETMHFPHRIAHEMRCARFVKQSVLTCVSQPDCRTIRLCVLKKVRSFLTAIG